MPKRPPLTPAPSRKPQAEIQRMLETSIYEGIEAFLTDNGRLGPSAGESSSSGVAHATARLVETLFSIQTRAAILAQTDPSAQTREGSGMLIEMQAERNKAINDFAEQLEVWRIGADK